MSQQDSKIKRKTILPVSLFAIVAIGLSLQLACNGPKKPKVYPGAELEFQVGSQTVTAEVVFENSTRQKGLMRKTPEEIPENWGMLFVFRDQQYLGFWMKDTWVPLSIAYIDDDGKILQISDMKPKDLRSVKSKHKVRYALELNRGGFERAGAGVGTVIPDFKEKVAPFLRVAEPRKVR